MRVQVSSECEVGGRKRDGGVEYSYARIRRRGYCSQILFHGHDIDAEFVLITDRLNARCNTEGPMRLTTKYGREPYPLATLRASPCHLRLLQG